MEIEVNEYWKLVGKFPEKMKGEEFIGMVNSIKPFIRTQMPTAVHESPTPRKTGVRIGLKAWNPEDLKQLFAWRAEGKSNLEIARLTGRTFGAINQRFSALKREGVILPKGSGTV